MRFGILVGVMVGIAAAGSAIAWQSEETRATMRALYDALSTAFVTSLDDNAFQDPSRREEILLSLRVLSANADQLEEHADELGADSDYLRRSLAADCRDAANRFDEGEYVGARFLLTKLTENCVACHSKQPPARGVDLGKQFIDDARIQSLEPEDRIRLEMATRQFDAAMETCESVMLDPNTVPEYAAVTGVFESYTKLAVRVQRDPGRAVRTFEAFSNRSDVPSYLLDLMTTWSEALRRLDPDDLDPDPATAKRLIDEAQELNRFPTDQRGLVQFVAASSALHTYLRGSPSGTDLAEAYYLLGLVETHISSSYWISESAFFLEQAIRAAPHTKTAREAFNLLEAYSLSAYTGSSGIHVPADVRDNLDELRALAR